MMNVMEHQSLVDLSRTKEVMVKGKERQCGSGIIDAVGTGNIGSWKFFED